MGILPPVTIMPGDNPSYGEECLDACDPGLECAPSNLLPDCATPMCCTNWCDLNAPENCPGGTVCTPYDPVGHEVSPQLSYLGLCLLPS